MSAADWYRRALGTVAPAPAPPPPTHNLPPTQALGPAQRWTGSNGSYYSPPSQPLGQPESMTQAIAYMNQNGWRGGEGVRTERYTCPRCNSDLFFTRASVGRVMGMPPAPRCQSCGFNGLWEQFGDQAVE